MQPMVIFSSRNHYNKTMIFGVAIVFDETIETQKWVLNVFLDCMCKKQPKVVIIDGNRAMREAIKEVFF